MYFLVLHMEKRRNNENLITVNSPRAGAWPHFPPKGAEIFEETAHSRLGQQMCKMSLGHVAGPGDLGLTKGSGMGRKGLPLAKNRAI